MSCFPHPLRDVGLPPTEHPPHHATSLQQIRVTLVAQVPLPFWNILVCSQRARSRPDKMDQIPLWEAHGLLKVKPHA